MDSDDLPLDSDVEVAADADHHAVRVRPRPAYLCWVFAGGAVGTTSRYLITQVVPSVLGVPVATFGINVVGAFLLGLLLELLTGHGDPGRRRTFRLLLGTGFLGGFTTYSALSVDTVLLLNGARPWLGIGYGLGTVMVGGFATVLGLLVGAPRPGT